MIYTILKPLSFSTLLLILFLFATATTNVGEYRLVGEIKVGGLSLTTDFLKNTYVLNTKNQVAKYDSTGRLVNRFEEDRYGSLTSVDATSPFKVVMFYKDFGVLVTTDIFLRTKNFFRLSSVGINNVSAACLSHDNYIWIFDTDESKLKKIDNQYKVIYESLDLTRILGTRIEPTAMLEKNGLVYVHVPGMGFLTFDTFGTFYLAISNTDLECNDVSSFQIINDNIVFYHEDQINLFNIFDKKLRKLPLPNIKNVRDVKVEQGRLVVLDNKGLKIYEQVN